MILAIVFLVIFLIIGIIEVALTENERFGWATLGLVLTMVGLQLFHVADILTFVRTNSLFSLEMVGAYLLVGLVWSFIKWMTFLRDFRQEVLRNKESFLEGQSLPSNAVLNEAQQADLRNFLGRCYPTSKFYPNTYNRIPRASDNKARITAWFGLWVFSMIGWLLNDPIAKVIDWVFGFFSSSYQRVSNFIFRDLKELK